MTRTGRRRNRHSPARRSSSIKIIGWIIGPHFDKIVSGSVRAIQAQSNSHGPGWANNLMFKHGFNGVQNSD
jgi:hypothetical protein